MRDQFIKDQEEKDFYKKIESFSDRELTELNLFYLNQIEKSSFSIKRMIQVIFYITIIGLILTAIGYFM